MMVLRASMAAKLSRSWPILVGCLLVLNTVVLVALLVPFRHGLPGVGPYRIDLDVYRIGSRVWFSGGDLYGSLPSLRIGGRLPFTYPPFAAIVLAPLTFLPFWLAGTLITLLSIGSLIGVCALVLRALRIQIQGRMRWLLLGAALPIVLLFEPVRTNLVAGQINVLLMALVVADCFEVTPRWSRGLLVGVAAAVKLTPAAFVLFLFISSGRRGVVNCVASFAACTGLAFLLAWHDSIRYWTGVVFDSTRIGNPSYLANQSIVGAFSRLGIQPPLRSLLWLALIAIVVVMSTIGIRRALTAKLAPVAVLLNAVTELLTSPVSWTHHWVWIVPLVLTFAVIGWQDNNPMWMWLSGAGLLLFGFDPPWWFLNATDHTSQWSTWQLLLSNCYVYFGLILLAVAAARPLRPRILPQTQHIGPARSKIRADAIA